MENTQLFIQIFNLSKYIHFLQKKNLLHPHLLLTLQKSIACLVGPPLKFIKVLGVNNAT